MPEVSGVVHIIHNGKDFQSKKHFNALKVRINRLITYPSAHYYSFSYK